jgi:hypothetical protein
MSCEFDPHRHCTALKPITIFTVNDFNIKLNIIQLYFTCIVGYRTLPISTGKSGFVQSIIKSENIVDLKINVVF